jgi:mono/diheme cytochrome c family protein
LCSGSEGADFQSRRRLRLLSSLNGRKRVPPAAPGSHRARFNDRHGPRAFGDRLYHEKADCQFCHGIDGDGRGDPRSPGKAPDLRATKLDREQLIEVVRCGRPGSQMPHFDKYAFEGKECYGLSAAELGQQIPPDPHSTSLTMREIEAVADFILAAYKGK